MKYHLKQASKQASKQGIFLLILTVAILQSCSQKLNVSQSPTAPSASEKADTTAKSGAGKGKVDIIQPLVPYYTQGATYNGGTIWQFDHWVPAPGKYLIIYPGGVVTDYSKLINYYGFTYVRTGDESVINEIGGSHVMMPIDDQNYETAITTGSKYEVKVYFADEPGYGAPSMQTIVQAVHQAGGVVWADDFNEQVVIAGVVVWEHLANSTALNAADVVGTDMYEQTPIIGGVSDHYYTCSDVITEYENFSSLFGQKFQFAWEEFDANYDCFTSAFSYLVTHNMNACGLYCDGGGKWNTAVPSDWSHVDAFCQNAENAGFLDRVDQLYTQTYVCQENGVRFTPTSPADCYGIYENGGYDRPTSADEPGEVLCWAYTPSATGQYETIP
jgi:hypothetical protein